MDSSGSPLLYKGIGCYLCNALYSDLSVTLTLNAYGLRRWSGQLCRPHVNWRGRNMDWMKPLLSLALSSPVLFRLHSYFPISSQVCLCCGHPSEPYIGRENGCLELDAWTWLDHMSTINSSYHLFSTIPGMWHPHCPSTSAFLPHLDTLGWFLFLSGKPRPACRFLPASATSFPSLFAPTETARSGKVRNPLNYTL